MTDTSAQPNKNLPAFVTASAVTMGGALVTIVSYVIHVHYGLGLPDEVEKAMMTLFEAAIGFAAHRLAS